MKGQTNTFFSSKVKASTTWALLIWLLLLTIQTDASVLNSKSRATDLVTNDTTLSVMLRKTLAGNTLRQVFHYPKSVERFYSQSQFQPRWISPEKDIRKTWEALLLLDCVLQFGLNHVDYHPNELLYSTMHDIMDTPLTVSPSQKVWFDLLLTDAMITFINHLHFGKLNPVYTSNMIDKGEISGFCADDILRDAIQQNDFMSAVLNVQPKVKEYVLMQDYMRLLKGQYVGDCYEASEPIVRKLAINMERLRWAAINEDSFILINIPSYTLKLRIPDTTYSFKVVVGKPANPTPVLQSSITHFSTAPDWKVPRNIFIKEMLPKALKNTNYLENNHFAIYNRNGTYVPAVKDSLMMVKRNPERYFMRQSAGCDNALGLVVFRFQNAFDIYLHDTPDQQFFDLNERALSHGCIRVQHAEELASLLLDLDGQKQSNKLLHQAIIDYQPRDFKLRKVIPLKITYLTCEIGDIGVVEYEDIYKQDTALEFAFYGKDSSLPGKRLEIKSTNR